METRHLLIALAAALAVYVFYTTTFNWLYPPPPTPPPATIDRLPRDAGPQTQPASAAAGVEGAAFPVAALTTQPLATQPGIKFSVGALPDTFKLGGGPEDFLQLVVDPRGASIANIRLTERTRRGTFAYRTAPRKDEPYELLAPVPLDGGTVNSFLTRSLIIKQLGDQPWRLDELLWEVVPQPAEKANYTAVFATTLSAADGAALLRVTKSFELQPRSHLVQFRLATENLSGQTLHVAIEQLGPIGIPYEDEYYRTRRLLAARLVDQTLKVDGVQRSDLTKHGERKFYAPAPSERFLWTALTNKYFGVFTRPLASGGEALPIDSVHGRLAAPLAADAGDLSARLMTAFVPLAAGAARDYAFELYAGPRDSEILVKANPDFADRAKLGYVAAQDADFYCTCTFHPLPEIMTWLLRTIGWIVRNYGVAIVALVFVVRGLLHPLSVFQQKSMYRMQEAMGRVQPKMDLLKEKYANDKVKLQQEMMKLWAEENVNPAGSLVAMVPLFVQMPILVALYVALSSDVHLRHAPFDGWWIRDLAAPDAFLHFGSQGIHVPGLSWIMGPIYSLNLLPILMGVSMYLQQKYMPKPKYLAKLAEQRRQQQQQRPSTPGSMTPEEQMRQQQMVANMMSIMFPFLFYSMPSGLNLYWFTTNLFGIGESIIIRRQLEAEADKREREGPRSLQQRKPGFLARLMKKLAEEAETLQKKADELGESKGTRKNKS